MRLITAADLVDGVETVLVTQLWAVVEAFELQDVLKPIKDWHALPTVEALTAAFTAVGAITSPGLVGEPTRHRNGTDATWRVVVNVFDRDVDHTQTTHRVQTWAGLIRACVLRNKTLGGISTGVKWAGERYDLIPARAAARTLGGCAVSFNVSATNVVDVDDLTDLPEVESVHPALTVDRGENA